MKIQLQLGSIHGEDVVTTAQAKKKKRYQLSVCRRFMSCCGGYGLYCTVRPINFVNIRSSHFIEY